MSIFYSLFCLLLPIFAHSCSTYNFACGNFKLEIQYPFYSDANIGCRGLHLIRCMNLVPLVQFQGEKFLYPVWNISYPDKTLDIHDLKLSAYFRGSNCVFLYDFLAPIPNFNVSSVTERVSSSQGFFNCEPNGYDFSHDAFKEWYNLTSCKDYSLDYSYNVDDEVVDDFPNYCATSTDIWFDWRLSFDDEVGNISLISVGFSRKWTPFPDCFSCQIAAGNCSSQCLKPSKQLKFSRVTQIKDAPNLVTSR